MTKLQSAVSALHAPPPPTSEAELSGSEPGAPGPASEARGSEANRRRYEGRVCGFLLGAAVLVYALLFTRLTFGLFDRCAYMNFDLGIFDQAVWLISRGERPFVTLRGVHILGDHFSVILYFIAPFYWIAPSPKTLLFLQNVALAVGALPIYKIAKYKQLNNLNALIISVLYLCYAPLQWISIHEFHPDSFLVPIYLFMMHYLIIKKYNFYFCLLILSMLVKENVGMTNFLLGTMLLVSKNVKIGLMTILISFSGMFASFYIIKYFNNSPSPYLFLYNQWGDNLGSIIKNIITQPIKLFDIFIANRIYFAQILIPIGFFSIFSPRLFILILPAVLTNILSNKSGMNGFDGQYAAMIIPFIFVSGVLGYAKISRIFPTLVLRILNIIIILLSLGTMIVWGPIPDALDSKPPRFSQEKIRDVHLLLQDIPDSSSVSAQTILGVYISHRKNIYHFPNPFSVNVWGGGTQTLKEIALNSGAPISKNLIQNINRAPVDYIAISPGTNNFPISEENYFLIVNKIMNSDKYGIEKINSGGILFKKNEDRIKGLEKMKNYLQCNSNKTDVLIWTWISKSGGFSK